MYIDHLLVHLSATPTHPLIKHTHTSTNSLVIAIDITKATEAGPLDPKKLHM